jgi:hypothetical protein
MEEVVTYRLNKRLGGLRSRCEEERLHPPPKKKKSNPNFSVFHPAVLPLYRMSSHIWAKRWYTLRCAVRTCGAVCDVSEPVWRIAKLCTVFWSPCLIFVQIMTQRNMKVLANCLSQLQTKLDIRETNSCSLAKKFAVLRDPLWRHYSFHKTATLQTDASDPLPHTMFI